MNRMQLVRKLARNLLVKMIPYRPYKPIKVSEEDWETLYDKGSWDHLQQLGERSRYSVVAGYCNYFYQTGSSILDIGCGEGILLSMISHIMHEYTGVDISQEAIRRASVKQDAKTVFICADAVKYKPEVKPDIIVFNECLYYFEDPVNLVQRYEAFLNEEGLIIISMYIGDRTKKVWQMLEDFFPFLDWTVVINRSNVSWKIACWKKGCSACPVSVGADLL